MAQRYFNWKLATVLVVAVVVFGAATFALHRWQKSTHAGQALPLGEAAYAKKDWDEACKQLGRYLAVNAEDVAVLLKYAEAQQNRQPITTSNLQQAVAAYRGVLRLQGDNQDAVRRLSELYLAMRMPGEAELITKRYLEGRDDLMVRRMLAMALAQQRKFKEAAQELSGIIAKDSSQVLAYELLGRLAEQRPQDVNQPAAFWFDEAVARNPKSALAYITRASFHAHVARKDFPQTLADLEQAEKCDLSDIQVRLRLVGELINANALDKARVHLKAIEATDPGEPALWLNWANLAARAGATEEMYAVAENGLKELAAEPWSFLPPAADLYIRCGRYEKAAECLTRMREKDVFPARVAYLDGLLAERRGQLRQAITAWQKALSLDRALPVPSLPAGTPIMLANALVRLGDNLSALGQLRAVIAANPASLDAHVALMRLLAQMKNWPEALEEARRVQKLAPGHTEAILLELQALAHALASAPAAGQEKLWDSINERLARVEKAGASALQVTLLRAQMAVIRGQFSEAEALLTDLENQYPGQLSVLLLHAEKCASEGKQQEALTRFHDVIEKFPQALEPVRSLAHYLERQNQRQECEATVQQAGARLQDPLLRRDCGLLLADLYRRWGQQDKVYATLTDLARQYPSDIQLKRQLLTCRQVMQDPARAQKIVDEIKAIEGNDGWQWRYEQVRVWMATAYPSKEEWTKRHYANAVKMLQENLLTSPGDQRSRMLLAAVHEKAGEPQTALTVYREALARSPEDVQVIVTVVSALYRSGEFTEAQEILDRAKQQGLTHPYLQRLQLQGARRRGDLTEASDILQAFLQQDPNSTSDSLALALVRMEEGNYVESGRILNTLRGKTPDSTSVLAAQIHLAVLQDNAEEAIRLCDEAIRNLNNSFAYMLRAETYVALKQNDKAAADFERAVALEPKKADIWVARSEFRYRSLGRVHDAIADIRKAMELLPDSVPIQKRAIALMLSSGEPALIREADRLVDRAISSAPADQRLRLFKAQILLLAGNNPAIEQARQVLREILDKYPKYADAWEWMARLELQMGDPGKAVETALRGLGQNPEDRQLLLVKALAEKESAPASAALTFKGLADQYPEDPDILIELADADVRAGRAEQAVEVLRQRLTKFNGSARRRCEMALAASLYKAGERENARVLFNSLMQAEPDDPLPVVTLAQLLGQEKRWSELNQLVTQWRGAHPDDTATTGALAGALTRTGDKEAMQMAEDLLRVMLERNPKSVPSLMLLAMLMQNSGRNEESVALNRRVLEVDPNNVVALNNLAWVLCEQQGQYQEALELAEKGLKMAPAYADLIDTRGTIHYRLGHLDEAVRDYSRCIELYPANLPAVGTSRFNLARAYAELGGSKTEAAQQLKQVIASCKTYSERGATTEAKKLLRQVLDLQSRTGVLPPENATEAQLLLDQLSQGG
jgi:tetratricopeptide (TPR) repeat protein